MTVLFSIIQVLNTGPVSEIGQMGNFLTTKRRPPVSTVKSEFPGYNGKREFFHLQNRMRQRVFSAWGNQTGPFAAHSAPFLPKVYYFFTFILGGQFLLPQRVN